MTHRSTYLDFDQHVVRRFQAAGGQIRVVRAEVRVSDAVQTLTETFSATQRSVARDSTVTIIIHLHVTG